MNDNFCFESNINGHHFFKDRWQAEDGDQLTVDYKMNNGDNKQVIRIFKDGDVVGHASCNHSKLKV